MLRSILVAVVLIAFDFEGGSLQAAQSKQEIVKECRLIYGGRTNYRKRLNTGMTVKMCIDQKMGGKK